MRSESNGTRNKRGIIRRPKSNPSARLKPVPGLLCPSRRTIVVGARDDYAFAANASLTYYNQGWRSILAMDSAGQQGLPNPIPPVTLAMVSNAAGTGYTLLLGHKALPPAGGNRPLSLAGVIPMKSLCLLLTLTGGLLVGTAARAAEDKKGANQAQAEDAARAKASPSASNSSVTRLASCASPSSAAMSAIPYSRAASS